jgi:hypothetical protein
MNPGRDPAALIFSFTQSFLRRQALNFTRRALLPEWGFYKINLSARTVSSVFRDCGIHKQRAGRNFPLCGSLALFTKRCWSDVVSGLDLNNIFSLLKTKLNINDTGCRLNFMTARRTETLTA